MPPALLEAARSATRNFTLEATTPHFDLVNAQLRQLRVAFALAQVGAGLGSVWLGCWQARGVGVPGSAPGQPLPPPPPAAAAPATCCPSPPPSLPTAARRLHPPLPPPPPAFPPLQITGRAVVLPKLMCGMDRWWAPHDGTIPGSALDLPYICPADHVLDLES